MASTSQVTGLYYTAVSEAPQAAREQIVVTGLGAVSTWGWSASSLWSGLGGNRTGIGPSRRFDTRGHRTRIVGEAPEPPDEIRTPLDRWEHYSQADRFAVAAAAEACRQAGLLASPPASRPSLGPAFGVFLGGSTAGMAEGEVYFRGLLEEASPRLRLLASHQLNSPGDEVARFLGVSGPVRSFTSACASGAMAVGAALDALRRREVEVAVAGGADSLCQLTYGGFNSLRAVDSQPCRPFRRERSGLSLRRWHPSKRRPRTRGAQPLARLLGIGASRESHAGAPGAPEPPSPSSGRCRTPE